MPEAKYYATRILSLVTRDLMQSVHFIPVGNDKGKQIYDFLCDECSGFLVRELLDGYISPELYNDTRNALGDMLYKVCFPDK